jgi:hypothetical protein
MDRLHARRSLALALAMLLAGTGWARQDLTASKGQPKMQAAAPVDPAWTELEREFALAWQGYQTTIAQLTQQGVEASKWPPSPVGDFWARCEPFADRGETGAVRWCVAYSESLELSPAEKIQFRRELFGKWAKSLPEGQALNDVVRMLNTEARADRLGLAPVSAMLAEIAGRMQDKSLRAEARATRASVHLAAGGPANVQLARESIALATEDDPRSETLVKARGRLFQLDRLQVGMTCPDFTAKDVDGVEFKRSDYLGKVVVLDFWGFW